MARTLSVESDNVRPHHTGKISRKEFLKFVGNEKRPSMRGETECIIRSGRHCLWWSCCHRTGMTNGFDVMPDDLPARPAIQ